MIEPGKEDLARMLRKGAEGVSASHQEYCISSDHCRCHEEADEMLAAADFFDPGAPEDKQRREDEAIVASVRGFPIFDDEEQGERYFAALERLSQGDTP